ncbi:MAG: DUF4136 domain-containing protein [Leeuwenhoekiella sp.]
MKILKSLTALLILITIYACGPRIKTTEQEDINLRKFKTFAYLPNTSIDIPKENQADDDVNELVIKTINGNLQKAGYRVNTNNPDLLVLVSTKIGYDTETTAEPTYASYPYGSGITTVNPYYNNFYYSGFANYSNIAGYNTDTYSYAEGTVVVDIIDRVTKKSVWKGATSESLLNENRADAIAQLVNEIFQKFPLLEG